MLYRESFSTQIDARETSDFNGSRTPVRLGLCVCIPLPVYVRKYQISRICPSISTSSMILAPSLKAMQNVSQSVRTLTSRWAVM